MGFNPFDVTPVHLAITLVGGFIVVFGMFSLFLREKLYIGEACWAFLFGVVIGPYGANIFSPRSWVHSDSNLIDSGSLNTITLEVTRIVLAIGVFAIGVELPKAYMKRHWRSLFFLLIPIMTWGWFVSAGLIYALIPGLSFLSSLAVAACLTPTDPILAAAVIGGKYADKHVPAHLRHLLAAESGCNDGAAFPFLFISIYLILDNSDAHAVQDWFLITILYEVLLGVIFGAVLGFGFRHLLRFCERNDLIDRKSYVAQYVALALFSVGATTLLGSDDLLSAFASGTAFAWDGFFNKQIEDSAFSSVIDLLFNIAAFIYIGAWMPFHLFSSEVLTLTVWRLIVLAILILILRRLPITLMLYRWIPDVKTFREAFFSGHFGPIGVGAIFISTLAVEQLPHPHDPPQNQVELVAASIQPVVAFMVLCSVAVHGLSIPFFSLGRRVHSVSRTWSRHQSTDLAMGPEWAMQTRRVGRAEDVVINRDRDDAAHVMEVGESEKTRSGTDVGNNTAVDKENEKSVSVEAEKREETYPHETTAEDQNPPDGDRQPGDVTEWREGHHLVIERDHGAGNEVEVEVVPNVRTTRTDRARTFQGRREHVRAEAEKYMQKLKEIPGAAEREVEHDIKQAKRDMTHVRDEAEEGIRHIAEDVGLAGSSHEIHDHEHVYEAEDEKSNDHEEGWHDEDAAVGVEDAAGPSFRKPAEKRPSKSSKHKAIPRAIAKPSRTSTSGKGRRLSLLGARPSKRQVLTQETPPPKEDTRGRDTTSRALPATTVTDDRTRHRLADSISRLRFEPTRAESPARSIRFADQQPPSGTQTPIGDRPGSSAAGGSNGDETPLRVAFDVPENPHMHQSYRRR